MILEWIVRGLVVAAATAAVVSVVKIVISGIITKNKLKEAMENKNVQNAIVEKVENCSNQVTLRDLENDTIYEVHGDGVDYNIDEGDIIYC